MVVSGFAPLHAAQDFKTESKSGGSPISSEELWYLLSGANVCTPVYRALQDFGVRAAPSTTPQEFATALEKFSGKRASVTYGGDDVPAMVFLRSAGNRGIADSVYTLAKGQGACAALVPPPPASATSNMPTQSSNATGTVSAVRKPSFDCSKAKSVSEKLICADGDLADLDRELASKLAAARKTTSDAESLRRANLNAWKEREATCQDKECLVSWFLKRLEALK